MLKKHLMILFILWPVALAAQGPAPRKFELRAESPPFWNLIDREAKLDRVATGSASRRARSGIRTASFT